MGNFIKSLISVILIIFLMATMNLTTTATTRTQDREQSIELLQALGVMEAQGGNFSIDNPITRGEFVKIIINLMGIEFEIQTENQDSKFTDINNSEILACADIASAMNIMRGVSETEFAPDDEVLFQDAITVIVRVLGYERFAESKGGYPLGYLVTATEQDVLDGIRPDLSIPITIGDLALMIENSLTIPKFINASYSSKGDNYVVSGTGGTNQETILRNNLGFEKYRAEILNLGNYTKEVESGINTSRVRISDSKIPPNYRYHDMEEVTFTLKSGLSAVGLKHTFQYLYVKEDVVHYMTQGSKNIFVYDYIWKFDRDEDDTPLSLESIINSKRVYFLNSGQSYELDGNVNVYYNAQGTKAQTPMDKDDTTLPSHIGKFAKANIENDQILSLYIYELTDDMIVKESSSSVITYQVRDKNNQILDKLDEASELTTILNGEAVEFRELKEDMLFSYWNVQNEYLLVASDAFIIAPFQHYNEDMAQIGQKAYFLSPTTYFSVDYGINYSLFQSSLSVNILGRDVYAYINARGEVSYIKAEADDPVFIGVVLGVYKEGFDDNIAIYRATGKGDSMQGIRVSYPLKLKNSGVSAQTASMNVGDTEGKGIYEFTLNGKGEIINIAEPNWKPYFDQVDFPALSEYIFPPGPTQNAATGVYTNGGISKFEVNYNRIRIRPKVFTADTSTDADGNYVGPRAGLRGNYQRETVGASAAERSYINAQGVPISDENIFLSPEELVPITAIGVERDVVLNDSTVIFSLLGDKGEFNPALIKLRELSGKNSNGASMLIENSVPYTRAAVILGGKDTIEMTENLRFGYVKELRKLTNDDYPDGFYRATIYTEDFLEKDYTILSEKANGIKLDTIIVFVESGIVISSGDDQVPPDVVGDGYIRVRYTYNPNDIKNDGTMLQMETAENNTPSSYVNVALSLNNYERFLNVTSALGGVDDRIYTGVDYVDKGVVQVSVNGIPETYSVAPKVLVYEYDIVTGKTTESSVDRIPWQSGRIWLMRRDLVTRAILYY